MCNGQEIKNPGLHTEKPARFSWLLQEGMKRCSGPQVGSVKSMVVLNAELIL